MEKSTDAWTSITENLSITKVQRSIRLKMIIAVVMSLLISSPISAYLNSNIKQYIEGSFGVYVNTIISLFVSTTVILLFVRFIILNPLSKVEEAIRKASEGDLTVKIQHNANDEIGRLSNSFNSMIVNLGNLLDKSNETIARVTNYSDQLNTIA